MNWTQEDEEELTQLYLNYVETSELAERFNRSKGAIESKLRRMGVKRGYRGYETHYRCTAHGWFYKEDIDTDPPLCPVCGKRMRTKQWNG